MAGAPEPTAAPTIVTQQHRFLAGVAGAGWGPVFLKATGGAPPYAWSLVSGMLPPGLTLESGGRLEGRTTTVGTYGFTVRVTDVAGGVQLRSFSIRVDATYQPPASLASVPRPFGYVQSAFHLGGGCRDPRFDCDPGDLNRHKVLIRAYQKRFDGGEVLISSLEDTSDFRRVRLFHQAVKEVRSEAGGREFLAVYNHGRLPDFFSDEDLGRQPASWRAQALKSDGSPWTRAPASPSYGPSIFGLHAEHVDITNDGAVRALTSRLAEAYDHEGPTTASVGPLNGFWELNEAKATPLYLPFHDTIDGGPDTVDLVPALGGTLRPTCAGRKFNPPLLREGDPCVLYIDGDTRFSHHYGPKRSLALFSPSARDRFVAYAAARGVFVTTLPADRREFNDADSQVRLPSHVSFVPSGNTVVWNVWKDWVYDVWHDYVDRIIRTVTFAQAGNPGFRGVIYFQLPGWATFRAPVKDQTLWYTYYDTADVLRTVADTLASFSRYDELDGLVGGTDVERMMKNPWITAWVHETTTPMVGVAGGTPDRTGDRAVLTSPTGIYEWNQQAEAVRLLAARNGKRFGLFARYFYFGKDTLLLSPKDWEWNWDRLMPLFKPDIVATLPPQAYLTQSDIADPVYRPLFVGDGRFGPSWTHRMGALRCALNPVGAAGSPSPAHAATRRPVTATLSWRAGANTTSQRVYLGTSLAGLTPRSTQTGTTFAPGLLAYGTTYYWRIDGTGPCGTVTGTVWRFTTVARWSIFTSQQPQFTSLDATPGWEVATRFTTSRAARVVGFRWWKAENETGGHTATLWTENGVAVTSKPFVNETPSGWQSVTFSGPTLTPGTRYRVSVNTNTRQVKTNGSLQNGPIVSGPLTADSSYYGQPLWRMPTSSSTSIFFVDVILEEV